MPRNTSLNWFIPAFVKSNVGSLAGTSDDECTRLWPLLSKKRRNFSRVSEPVGIILYSKRTYKKALKCGGKEETETPDHPVSRSASSASCCLRSSGKRI